MTEILNAIATRAYQLDTKPKKNEVFEYLLELIEKADINNDGEIYRLANMYLYFQPNLPKIAKNPFQWAAKAVANKSDPRYYIRSLNVTDKYIDATDGHRLHRVINHGLRPGRYDINGNIVDSAGTFPDVERVVKCSNYDNKVTTVSLKTLEVVKLGPQHVDCYVLPCGTVVSCRYVKDAVNGERVIKYSRGTSDHDAIKIINEFGIAIVIPVRQ